MASTAAPFLIMAVGETYIIVTAGIDLSCGSVLVFSGVAAAEVMNAVRGAGFSALATSTPTPASWDLLVVGLLVALASGAGWGLFNGLIVAYTGIPALIVTLGSFGMALGLADLITGGLDVTNVPSNLSSGIGNGSIADVPWLVVIAAGVTVVGALMLTQSTFGQHTYAIGSHAEAARRAGIHVRGHLVRVYVLAGLLAGLAGYLSLARYSTTTISGHATDNLTVITGVVLGGTSLFGGYGKILGTTVGILIPVVLAAGFVIIDVEPFWQDVAVGALLILAVYMDLVARRHRLVA